MEKKIIFTPVEPNRNLLWLHYRGDLLVLERFGSNGWESIGGTGSVTEEEFIEALKNKADLVSGKVPAEQLPSYVDDVIEFESITNGSNPINFYLNNQSYTDKVYYIQGSTSIEGTLSFKYNKKFINFGTNTSEDDWIIVEPEEGKIYIKIGSGNDSNHSFRWSGSDLIDLDKNWSDRINTLELKTLTSNLGTITDPLDLSVSTSTSSFQQLYTYLNQRNKSVLINLLWYYNGITYSAPIIDVDPVEGTFAIYNQGYLQTYKVLKEDDNYSLVRVNNIPEFVSLDYSQIGVALSDDLIERLKNAAGVIINDDTTHPNTLTAYISSWKTDTYLVFTKNNNVSSTETFIFFKSLSVDLNSKRANFASKRYTLPYGAYSQFGFTGKNADAVNQEVARLVNMNSYNITSSDLNKVHSGDKLESIKNATFLILDEGSGKTRIFIRGYSSDATIYYNCLESNVSTSYITLELPSNLLKSIRNSPLDDVMFNNYSANGGTKINKKSMYKELVAQLTINTYVIDSSKLNTTITDTNIIKDISKANILIIENSTDNTYMILIRGFVSNNMIYFFNLKNANSNNITATRVSFNTTTNLLSSSNVYLQSAFNAYKLGGGTKYTTESTFNTRFAEVMDA